MARRLTLYIASQVLKGVATVALALVGISALFEFIAYIDELSKAHVSLGDIFSYVAYALPGKIYDTFPPAVLIGSLLALGSMASHGELVAMRAATVSKLQISLMVAVAGLLLMGFILLIGEFVLPMSEQHKQHMKNHIRWDVQSDIVHDVWLKENTFFIHIDNVLDENELHGITAYQIENVNDKQHMLLSMQAQRAEKNGSQWILHTVKQYNYSDTKIDITTIAQKNVNWQFHGSLLKSLGKDASALSIDTLAAYADYMQINNLDDSRYRLSFWLKLLSPITVMVMLFMALPFAFGSLRSMASGNLIVVGLIIGLLYYIASGITSNIGQLYGLPPFVNAFAPTLIFMCITLLLILRQRF